MKVLRTVNGVKVLEKDLKNFTIRNKRVMSILAQAKNREEDNFESVKKGNKEFTA